LSTQHLLLRDRSQDSNPEDEDGNPNALQVFNYQKDSLISEQKLAKLIRLPDFLVTLEEYGTI
tara:strand:- start:310 stop:498 length:189 start_codon:yes stop_codon:yes gene_type:complete